MNVEYISKFKPKSSYLTIIKLTLYRMEIEEQSVCKTPFPLPFKTLEQHKGPTMESFWVELNKILCGPFPGAINDNIHIAYIGTLLRCGCSTFVCLCEELDPTDNNKAINYGLRPYFDVAQKIYDDCHFWDDFQNFRPKQLDILYFPLQRNVKHDDVNKLYEFCKELVNKVNKGECLYIHSIDGNNRAVFISTIVLMLLKGYSAENSIKVVDIYYSQRSEKSNEEKLLSDEQRQQIEELHRIHTAESRKKK